MLCGSRMDSDLDKSASICRRMNVAQWARRSFVLSILVLGLGVFLWGMAYKMSLYESSPIHNKVPVAKLSSQASSAHKDRIEAALTPRNVTAIPLLLELTLAIVVFSLCSGYRFDGATEKQRRFCSFHFPPALFLRPPPFPLLG